jgi:hypothetical protein
LLENADMLVFSTLVDKCFVSIMSEEGETYETIRSDSGVYLVKLHSTGVKILSLRHVER